MARETRPTIQEYNVFLRQWNEDKEEPRLSIAPFADFSVDEYLNSYVK
jgi:hypothetical protein